MRKITITLPAALAFLGLCGLVQASSIFADSVNTAFGADNGAYWGENDAGWLYTPSSSYSLSGIDTEFSIPNGTVVENRTVTVVVYQGNTPFNGGTLLGSFAFDSATAEGILAGGSFAAPIALTAGQQYFVGFQNVGPMSGTANVDDIGVNFTADPSAVVLSDLFYDGTLDCNSTTGFSCELATTGANSLLGAPILEFFQPSQSTVPEPQSFLLLGVGFLGMGCLAAKHRVRRR